MSDEQAMLDAWMKEAGIGRPVRFMGCMDLGHGTLGICRYLPDGSCSIYLASCWEGRSGWLRDSVLWHEAAHAIAYLEDMKVDGHNSRWREIRARRRAYVIGDAFAKLLYSPRTW